MLRRCFILRSAVAAVAAETNQTQEQEQQNEATRRNISTSNTAVTTTIRSNERVAAAFHRLLAQPYYALCPLRRSVIQHAIDTASNPNTPPMTVKDLVLDGFRKQQNQLIPQENNNSDKRDNNDDHNEDKIRKFPGLGTGLRRIALETLDPTITSYACTFPSNAIPFDEVEEHVRRIRDTAKALNPQWVVSAVGGHRRGAFASRTVDVLISDPATSTTSWFSPPSSSSSFDVDQKGTSSSSVNYNSSSSNSNYANDAPFQVLSKLRRALIASGYLIHASQQRGSGIATVAALGLLEPPDSVVQEALQLAAARREEQDLLSLEVPHDPLSSLSSSSSSFSSSPLLAAAYWTKKDKEAAANPEAARAAALPTKEQLERFNNSNNKNSSGGDATILNNMSFNIAHGVLPEKFVTAKSASIMDKLMAMHQRQRQRILKEDIEAKSKSSGTDLASSLASSSPADESQLEKEVNSVLKLPTSARDVLRDISSSGAVGATGEMLEDVDGDEDDDDDVAQQERDEGQASKNTDTTKTAEAQNPAMTTSASAKTTTAISPEARVLETELQAFHDRKKQQKRDAVSANFNSTTNFTLRHLNLMGDNSNSNDIISGSSSKKHHMFPLNTRKLPRRINLVFAPFDRFYALQLLLTGPRDFTDFLLDRAPRFGYRLTEDGLFEPLGLSSSSSGFFGNNNNTTTFAQQYQRQQAVSQIPGLPKSSATRRQQMWALGKINAANQLQEQQRRAAAAAVLRPGDLAVAAQKQSEATARFEERQRQFQQQSKFRQSSINSEGDLLRRLDLRYVAPIDR